MAAAVLFVLYCLEAGAFFVLVPWTRFWDINPLLHMTPGTSVFFESLWIRGFVSGLGVVHLLIGVREIFVLVASASKEGAPR